MIAEILYIVERNKYPRFEKSCHLFKKGKEIRERERKEEMERERNVSKCKERKGGMGSIEGSIREPSKSGWSDCMTFVYPLDDKPWLGVVAKTILSEVALTRRRFPQIPFPIDIILLLFPRYSKRERKRDRERNLLNVMNAIPYRRTMQKLIASRLATIDERWFIVLNNPGNWKWCVENELRSSRI